MAVVIFEKQDKQYLRWLYDYKDGFVVNARKSIIADKMTLHRSRCLTIGVRGSEAGRNAFTGRGSIKVCSESVAELLEWIRKNGGRGFIQPCPICAPSVRR